MYFIFSTLGIRMSSLSGRIAASIETRLSVVTRTVANLKARLSELTELRERVRKAQLSAQTSRRRDLRRTTRL
jgi:hypothetical protein